MLALFLTTPGCSPPDGGEGSGAGEEAATGTASSPQSDSGASAGAEGTGGNTGAVDSSGAAEGVGPSGDPSGGSGDDGPIPPELCRFDAEVAFTLPDGFGNDALDDLSDDSGALCFEGEHSFTTLDMNGDLLPDLVVADDCDHEGVGTDRWNVYLHETTGFAASPIDWSLPGGFGRDQLDDLSEDEGSTCFEGELSFVTRDMDGDLQPDLVVTDRCDLAGVGTEHWEVFLSDGTGFAGTAIDWALPGGFATDQLDDAATDESGLCTEGELSTALLDMDGDLMPDLVISDRCDVAGVGTDHWEVYLNDGTGFAATPTLWGLPSDFATDQLDDIAGDEAGLCTRGELSFVARDMDGDLRPDLVVTDHCDLAGVGTDHWQVFLNDGTGFGAQPQLWALPRDMSTDAFDDASDDSSASCVYGEHSFTLLDVDGDLLPDLLVADDCDLAHTGTTHWSLFRNNGSGFDPPGSFTLPTDNSEDAFDDIAADEGNACFRGEHAYQAVDINGDRVPDLVVADDCDFDGVGTTHWRVFEGSCEV